MNGHKMVMLYLTLALAMIVASQPLETIVTSNGATLSTQLLNWVQVGVETFLIWFGFNTDKENAKSEYTFYIFFSPNLENHIAYSILKIKK